MDYTPKVNLNVPITIKKPVDLDSNDQIKYELISNNDVPIVFMVEWKGVYGNEVFSAYAENSAEIATITMRYHPDIKADCLVVDPVAVDPAESKTYEIIGTPDNIGKRNQWLQFKIRRFENG